MAHLVTDFIRRGQYPTLIVSIEHDSTHKDSWTYELRREVNTVLLKSRIAFNTHTLYNFSSTVSPTVSRRNDPAFRTGGTSLLRCDMIKNVKQYQELASMVEMAEENLGSLRFGSHYALKAYLKKHFNLITGDNRDTIKKARRLLDEFMTAYTSEED